MAETLDNRFIVLMSEKDRRDLKALALTNTGGNESELMRLILRIAADEPKRLGLNKPLYVEGKAFALAGTMA